jgi:hypothetical protein
MLHMPQNVANHPILTKMSLFNLCRWVHGETSLKKLALFVSGVFV